MKEEIRIEREAGGNWIVPKPAPGFPHHVEYISRRETMLEIDAELRAKGFRVIYVGANGKLATEG